MTAISASNITNIGKDVGIVQTMGLKVQSRATKYIVVYTDATAVGGGTVSVSLAAHDLANILTVTGVRWDTANSVQASEAPTTAVASGVLTITISGTIQNVVRAFIIQGERN